MANASGRSSVGRQTHMPFKRAFIISVNGLRMRFWRSMITAGGIFLGIAFLTTVLTQSLMQWPRAEKIAPGYVSISGQVVLPDDYEAWKPIPVEEGLKAGIPAAVIEAAVIEKVAPGEKQFSLAAVVQGQYQAKRADKNLARVLKEWRSLKKLRSISVYVGAASDEAIKVDDAVKAGVPRKVAKRLAGKKNTFQGSDLVAVIEKEPSWVKPIYARTARDHEITINDAVEAGVPKATARLLAGDGRSFKGAALNTAIKEDHPRWMKIWRARVKRNAIFKMVDRSAVDKLSVRYAITLADLLKTAETVPGQAATAKEGEAAGESIDSDWTNVMMVNLDGRKDSVNLEKSPSQAAAMALGEGDNIFVPDRNTRYRMVWLVVMSLLVCTVGITNSMLMSVTERFKEIGTMKCLGALDSFVVTLFLLESGMMGIAASVTGWVVGFGLMVLIAGFSRGWDIVASIGLIDTGRMFLLAVGVGVLLTILATIAPAQRAASMPAAMALRSEI